MRLRIVPTTTAAASERRGTPGAMLHCQIIRHFTMRGSFLDAGLALATERSATPKSGIHPGGSRWLFATAMLHLDDSRLSGPKVRKRRTHASTLESPHVEEVFDAPQRPEGGRVYTASHRRQ